VLPTDIETEDALRHLSFSDDSPKAVSRRRFLQALAIGGGSAALLGAIPLWRREGWTISPIKPTDGVLVLIQMSGGNDGLNTVVPTGAGAYYDKRKSVSISPSAALPLANGIGLHPNLTFIKQMYDQGKVAVVQGVGVPNPDLSHFSSMATWMQGWGGTGSASGGWVGRWLDGMPLDGLHAVTISSTVPLDLVGTVQRATALGDGNGMFGASTDPNDIRLFAGVKDYATASTGLGAFADAFTVSEKTLIETAGAIAPAYTPALPDGELVRDLTLAARLINTDVGVRVVQVEFGGFDTHADEINNHGSRMAVLNAGIQAFFAALAPAFASRTTVMTFSEFGREVISNDSGGTDHGTAAPLFVIGSQVRGGLVGTYPSLTNLADGTQLVLTTDFRSVYASILERWMGADSTQVLGKSFSQLDLFTTAPGGGPGGTTTTTAATTTTVAATTTTTAATTTTAPATTTTTAATTTTTAPATTTTTAATTTTTPATTTTTAPSTTTVPSTTTTTPGGASMVNFDDPAPPGSSRAYLNGAFGGIDFGLFRWRWRSASDSMITNHIVFGSRSATLRSFGFVGGPKVFDSVVVCSTSASTVVLTDDTGQLAKVKLEARVPMMVLTGWSRPSGRVRVKQRGRGRLMLDDLTYHS